MSSETNDTREETVEVWAIIHAISDNERIRAHREELARRVAAVVDRNSNPDRVARVVCILDNQDHAYLKEEFGSQANRGIHWPIQGRGVSLWPYYTHNLIAPPIGLYGDVSWPYISVVYLHGSTSETDIGLTLTLAHELQHFLQYSQNRALWAANILLMNLRSEEFKVWWDFPIEIEARITAKRVAEELFGKEAVHDYIMSRIEARVTDNDAEDWRFVQHIDTGAPYDLFESTSPLVRGHREELDRLLAGKGVEQDFAAVDLDSF
jgi:hypothetical protein